MFWSLGYATSAFFFKMFQWAVINLISVYTRLYLNVSLSCKLEYDNFIFSFCWLFCPHAGTEIFWKLTYLFLIICYFRTTIGLKFYCDTIFVFNSLLNSLLLVKIFISPNFFYNFLFFGICSESQTRIITSYCSFTGMLYFPAPNEFLTAPVSREREREREREVAKEWVQKAWENYPYLLLLPSIGNRHRQYLVGVIWLHAI